MIELDIKNDIGKTLSKFPWVRDGMIPKLVSNVLNSTAYHTAIKIKEEMPNAFDRPTPFTLRAVYAWRSTPQNLNAEVRVRNFAAKGNAAIQFLSPEIYGGVRNPKRSEILLRNAGILPQGMFIVPGAGAPLDQYGNISRSLMVKILSQVRALSEVGFKGNAKGGPSKKYFAVNKPGGLTMGIYERRGREIVLLIAFVKQPHYQKRLRYYEIADEVARVYFPDKLKREAEYLTRTNGARFSEDVAAQIANLLK